jgi:hypothetical protein
MKQMIFFIAILALMSCSMDIHKQPEALGREELSRQLDSAAEALVETFYHIPGLYDDFLNKAALEFNGAHDVLYEDLRTAELDRSIDQPVSRAAMAGIPDFTFELYLPWGMELEECRSMILPLVPMRYDVNDSDLESLTGYLPGGEIVKIGRNHPAPYILLSRNDRLQYSEEERAALSENSKLYLQKAYMSQTNEFGSAPEIWVIFGSGAGEDSTILTRKDLRDFNKKKQWWETSIDLFRFNDQDAVVALWFEDDPDWWWEQLQEITIAFDVSKPSFEFDYKKAENQSGVKAIRMNDEYMGDAIIYKEDLFPALYSTGSVQFQIGLENEN